MIICNKGSTAPDNGASLTMAVQPTNFENKTTNVEVTADQLAQEIGFKTMEDFEVSQQMGSMSAIEMEVHENNALLAASGDTYPFTYQFNPVDADAGLGLYFDPTNFNQFESFDMTEFVDFSDPSMGIAESI